jgi:predicted type IV restriction endonuclease
VQKSLQTQSADSATKLEALHSQLQEAKGAKDTAESKCAKVQQVLEEKAEKLNATQQKLQVCNYVGGGGVRWGVVCVWCGVVWCVVWCDVCVCVCV